MEPLSPLPDHPPGQVIGIYYDSRIGKLPHGVGSRLEQGMRCFVTLPPVGEHGWVVIRYYKEEWGIAPSPAADLARILVVALGTDKVYSFFEPYHGFYRLPNYKLLEQLRRLAENQS